MLKSEVKTWMVSDVKLGSWAGMVVAPAQAQSLEFLCLVGSWESVVDILLFVWKSLS